MEANVEIDLTATDMLDDLRHELAAQGIVVALARVKHDLAVYLERSGFISRDGSTVSTRRCRPRSRPSMLGTSRAEVGPETHELVTHCGRST